MATDTLIDYYSRRAAEYEAIYSKPERQADLANLRVLLAQRAANHRVLELACGTGYWTAVLASTAESVVAIDKSPEVLEIARGKGLPRSKVTFLEADAYSPSAEPGQFTAVFAGFWLSHVPKQQLSRHATDIAKVMGPGALVVFFDNSYVVGSSTPISRTDEFGNSYQLRMLGDGSKHEVLKNFLSPSELKAFVGPVGHGAKFTQLQHYWVMEYINGQQGVPADGVASRRRR